MCCFQRLKRKNKKLNQVILDFDPSSDAGWLDRLDKNKGLNPGQYILANPGDIIVTEQLHCYLKAERKYPDWHKTGLTYTRLAFEQSSGQAAAIYKSSLASGDTIWDLTGGLGIDSYAFSRTFRQVHYCEKETQPFLLAKNNHHVWGTDNIIHHHISAEEAVSKIKESDWVYIDPSRRNSARRTFLLKDCEPNVMELLPQLARLSTRIMIKLSPLYDIKRLLVEIPQISDVKVVSVDGEVKEILAIIDKNTPRQITSVCLPERFELSRPVDSDGGMLQQPMTAAIGAYLHVPDAAIIKALTTRLLCDHFTAGFWGKSDYLTSDRPDLPGCRSYKIIETQDYKPKTLKKQLKGKKVNIHRRNFPVEVSELYKTLQVQMGDDLHLFFTTGTGNRKIVCITTRPA